MKYFISVSIVLCSITTAAAQGLPAWRQVIPAVASVKGNQGSDWRTDVVIHNPEFERWVGSEMGDAAAIDGAKSLAMTAAEFLNNVTLQQ